MRQSYWERLAAAAQEGLNLASLAALAVGVGSYEYSAQDWRWWPWLTMLTGEAAWLLVGPQLPPYRKLLVARQARRARMQKLQELHRLLHSLPPELVGRYEMVQRLHQDILRAAAETGAVASDLLAEELDKLEALLAAFLRLLVTWMRYRQYLNRTDGNAIAKDIAHLKGKLERTNDPDTQRIVQQNLAILEKRQERVNAITRGYFNLQAQLEVIEDTFHLINDQMVSLRAPENFRIDLGQIISGVETTEEVLIETNALIAEHY